MSNPNEYTWFHSSPNPDGSVEVYAGWGDQPAINDFYAYNDGGNHGHFRVGPNGEDLFGRSGPSGSQPDYGA